MMAHYLSLTGCVEIHPLHNVEVDSQSLVIFLILLLKNSTHFGTLVILLISHFLHLGLLFPYFFTALILVVIIFATPTKLDPLVTSVAAASSSAPSLLTTGLPE